jgi:hypothetical protein
MGMGADKDGESEVLSHSFKREKRMRVAFRRQDKAKEVLHYLKEGDITVCLSTGWEHSNIWG